MSFNAIRENKIPAKISEFTVLKVVVDYFIHSSVCEYTGIILFCIILRPGSVEQSVASPQLGPILHEIISFC